MVTPEHEAFSRAVVALAREHRMNNLRLVFRKSRTAMDAVGPYEEVEMNWSEGRHGDVAPITLATRGQHTIGERE